MEVDDSDEEAAASSGSRAPAETGQMVGAEAVGRCFFLVVAQVALAGARWESDFWSLLTV